MKTTLFEFHSLNVRKVLGLGAMTLALAILPACSDDDIANGGGDEPIPDQGVTPENVTVNIKRDPSLAMTYLTGSRTFDFSQLETSIPEPPKSSELNSMLKLGNEGRIDIYITDKVTADEFVIPDLSNQIYVPAGYYTSIPSSLVVKFIHDYDYNDGNAIQWWFKETTISNPKYYIDGAVTFNGVGSDGDMEIHILSGGSLIDNQGIRPGTKVYLHDGGVIKRAGNENQLSISGELYAEDDIDLSNSDMVLEKDSKIYTTGKIKANNINVNGGHIFAGCEVHATKNIIFKSGNSTLSLGYVKAETIEIESGFLASIILRDKGCIIADNLQLRSVDDVTIEAEAGGTALVKTKTLLVNDINLQNTFHNLGIIYDERTGSEEGDVSFNESCQVNGNNKITLKPVSGSGACAPYEAVGPGEENPNPTPNPTPELTIENIGSISPSEEHGHDISATSIYTVKKGDSYDAYISWHTQGSDFHGCIEHALVRMVGDKAEVNLQAYLETAPTSGAPEYKGAVDFNHVIFDNGKIFVAGDHPQKGSILGWVDCDEFNSFPTGNSAELNLLTLYRYEYKNGTEIEESNGGSGNCIIRNGDYYQVASMAGFETFNVSSFSSSDKIKSVGKLPSWKFRADNVAPINGWERDKTSTGKHIATDGNRVAMLTLVDRDGSTNTAKASIQIYDANDVKYENMVASYIINDEVLSPVNGKDVIAIQGNDVWVCLGKGGIKHLAISGSSMTEVASYKLIGKSDEEIKKLGLTKKRVNAACANGLAVDDKYVYIAHGGAGVFILDKNDLSHVANTRNDAGGSANYISLKDDILFVAYGKSKVQVYRFNEN